MKKPKDKYEHLTKTSRIEWTVTEGRAAFYILDPPYHGHPWTACITSRPQAEFPGDGSEISTYAFGKIDPQQTEALIKALQMASKWSQGKKISGAKKISTAKSPAAS